MSQAPSSPPAKAQWFTETYAQHGSSFGLAITAQCQIEHTPYQTIAIYDTTHFGKLMVIDDCIMLTTKDNFLYHEMLTHPALFTHPRPQDIVIIGGGDCGTLQQVLLHAKVTTVTQVEIDERVTRLAEIYFPELCTSNNDPRAKLLFADGIEWIKSQADASLDIIIVDSTDPIGPAAGLFNVAFYQECQRVLRQDGIIVQQSESPLYHATTIIPEMRQAMHAAGLKFSHTLCFPQPCYPSGWWSATMASKQPVPQFRQHDASNKSFKTKYYNAAIHQAALATPEFLNNI